MRQVADPDRIARIYESLLLPTFPPSELVSLESILRGVDDGRIVITVSGEAPEAVAIGWWDAERRTMLLGYLAVAAASRSKGLGSALMRDTLAWWHERFAPLLVVAEVEHPCHHHPHPVFGDPEARVRFYGRLGGRILDLPYFQGQVAPGMGRVYGMMLVVLWAAPGILSPDGESLVDVDRLRSVLQLDDSDLGVPAPTSISNAVVQLREALGQEPGVRLVPVDAYGDVAVALPPAPA